MSDIWNAAAAKGFDKDALGSFMAKDGKDIVNKIRPANGLSPLIHAIRVARPSNVQLLLNNGADPGKPAEDKTDRTPLHFAAALDARGRKVVEALLAQRPSNFDEPAPGSNNETPLMIAVREGQDPGIVEQLVRVGASLENKRSDGKTAKELAEDLPEPKRAAITKALEAVPDRDRGGIRTFFDNWAIHVLAYFKTFGPVRNILTALSKVFYGIQDQEPPAMLDGEGIDAEPGSAEEVQGNLTQILEDKDLSRFYPAGDTYLEDVAKKITQLKDNPLKEPPELKGLAELALYQPVIYCDDSASMRDNRNTEKRWPKQQELVKKITEITNRAVPGKRGAHLRFQNKYVSGTEHDNLQGDEIAKQLQEQPSNNNWTPIGSGLKNHVLEPLVYAPIRKGEGIPRPMLIMITTDGCPSSAEDADQNAISIEYTRFKDAIVDSMKFLKENGYRRDTVIFCLNQIGSHPDATWFMEELRQATAIQDVLHLTTDRLDDDRFESENADRVDLERWSIRAP